MPGEPSRPVVLSAIAAALLVVSCSLAGYYLSSSQPAQTASTTSQSRRRQTPYAPWLGHWERSWVDDDKAAWLLEQNGVPSLVRRAILAIRSERRFEIDEETGVLVVHAKLIGGVWRTMRCGDVDELSVLGYSARSRLECRRDLIVATSTTTDWEGVVRSTEQRHTLRRRELLVTTSGPGGAYDMRMRKLADDGGRPGLLPAFLSPPSLPELRRWARAAWAPAGQWGAALASRLHSAQSELGAALAQARTHALARPAELLSDVVGAVSTAADSAVAATGEAAEKFVREAEKVVSAAAADARESWSRGVEDAREAALAHALALRARADRATSASAASAGRAVHELRASLAALGVSVGVGVCRLPLVRCGAESRAAAAAPAGAARPRAAFFS